MEIFTTPRIFRESLTRKLFGNFLISVNNEDKCIGIIRKLKAHSNKYIYDQKSYPHRAFTILLWNMKGEMLIQKRSNVKMTFPNYWSNTCCSHPIFFPSNLIQYNQIGIKRAAIERLQVELGISKIKSNDLKLFSKILYKAKSNNIYGEYECFNKKMIIFF